MTRIAVAVVLGFVLGAGCGGSSVGPGEDAGPESSCDPNPCTDEGRTTSVVEAGAAECRCDAGYHDLGAACVKDEACTQTSCNRHGSCDDSGGAPVCECELGYTGQY